MDSMHVCRQLFPAEHNRCLFQRGGGGTCTLVSLHRQLCALPAAILSADAGLMVSFSNDAAYPIRTTTRSVSHMP
jgi:hypothetical protein